MTIRAINSPSTMIVRQEIKENDGYCPCALEKTPDTKCMCQDFLKNVTNGYCHCGLYKKVKV